MDGLINTCKKYARCSWKVKTHVISFCLIQWWGDCNIHYAILCVNGRWRENVKKSWIPNHCNTRTTNILSIHYMGKICNKVYVCNIDFNCMTWTHRGTQSQAGHWRTPTLRHREKKISISWLILTFTI